MDKINIRKGDYVYSRRDDENFWSVEVSNKIKTEYGPIEKEIDGMPVTNMACTFEGCTELTVAPVIPDSVTSMYRTFYECKSLTTAPAIPSSVTSMTSTFGRCTSLETVPAIPSGVRNMTWTFAGCTKLHQKLFDYVKSGIEDGTILPFEVERLKECAICVVVPEGILLCSRNFEDVIVEPISSSKFAMDRQFDKYTPTNASVEDTLKKALELFSSDKSPIEIMNMVAERSKTATLVENGSLDEKLKKLDEPTNNSHTKNNSRNTPAYDNRDEI